ncbi:hypothetical protein EVAR_52066_1 [Eumeta japonica]|uniref:Uncharacterized protein n=1 Tax=Eumeta variegata TaxID=151549 RepID=A0A4C1Y4V4_EUMVA|nr:hypothetical protein EVAR_52066_1 [Eumeta japonica]
MENLEKSREEYIVKKSGQDLPYGFLGFSPGPRGFKAPPAKSRSQTAICVLTKSTVSMWTDLTNVCRLYEYDFICPLPWRPRRRGSISRRYTLITPARCIAKQLDREGLLLNPPRWPAQDRGLQKIVVTNMSDSLSGCIKAVLETFYCEAVNESPDDVTNLKMHVFEIMSSAGDPRDHVSFGRHFYRLTPTILSRMFSFISRGWNLEPFTLTHCGLGAANGRLHTTA